MTDGPTERRTYTKTILEKDGIRAAVGCRDAPRMKSLRRQPPPPPRGGREGRGDRGTKSSLSDPKTCLIIYAIFARDRRPPLFTARAAENMMCAHQIGIFVVHIGIQRGGGGPSHLPPPFGTFC